MSQAPILVWFRQDLRLADHPALHTACSGTAPVIALYVLDDETPGGWAIGGAGRWWLHHSLTALGQDLQAHGIPLILRRGKADEIVLKLADETKAQAVLWNRCYEPTAIRRDAALKETLKAAGLRAESFNAALLHEPWTIKTGGGTPYRVFTPFWNACRAKGEPPAPLPKIKKCPAPDNPPHSDDLKDWHLLPTKPNWAAEFPDHWRPGEAHAKQALADFIDDAIGAYDHARDRPALPGTSRLSPHLHWGEMSPRQIWTAVQQALTADKAAIAPATVYLKELVWREFSYHLLFHNPALPDEPLNPRFADFPWIADPKALHAWQRGLTGYPIVDAGMRQLWQSGWMHNRVRMITGSFLVKHLRQRWQAGEAWFWDTLVDADLASNAASWQWISGCGADAAPYFRIFNPMLQGAKFDPQGDYVKRWVPELADLPAKYIHQPWEAPAAVLEQAGIVLGKTYPLPIVDHAKAREQALSAYRSISKTDDVEEDA